MKVAKRVRRGLKGLYYTNGKLDNCIYNKKNAGFFELVVAEYMDIWRNERYLLLEYLKNTFELVLYILSLPVLPFIRVWYTKYVTYADIETEVFSSDYYEVVQYEEE